MTSIFKIWFKEGKEDTEISIIKLNKLLFPTGIPKGIE